MLLFLLATRSLICMTSSRRIVHGHIQYASQRIGCGKRQCLTACREIGPGHVSVLSVLERKKIKIKRSDGYRCGGGAIPKRTYPVASDFVRPDQLAIEAEIRPLLRIGACVGTCSCGIAVIRGVGGCGSVVGLRHDGRGGYVCPPSSCI